MHYDRQFYDTIRNGTIRSAQTVVPFVYDLIRPRRVLDVGCGEGWWLKTWADHGCTVTGIDGAYLQGAVAIPPDRFLPMDLATERLPGLFADLTMSLEVAEHLPPGRAETFVEDLCTTSGVVLFSAAIPGQGGVNHLNERWPDYWAQLFRGNGYLVSGALRWVFWGDAPEAVENWYAQNLLLCVSGRAYAERQDVLAAWFNGPHAVPFPVVHPVLWESRR